MLCDTDYRETNTYRLEANTSVGLTRSSHPDTLDGSTTRYREPSIFTDAALDQLLVAYSLC